MDHPPGAERLAAALTRSGESGCSVLRLDDPHSSATRQELRDDDEKGIDPPISSR